MIPGLKDLSRAAARTWKKVLPGKDDLEPAPGLYHFRRELGEEKTRLHLRIDPDGHGTLLINASEIVHFNPTAALMTFLHLEDISQDTVLNQLIDRFQVSRSRPPRIFRP